MAFIGQLDRVINCVDQQKFAVAIAYLKRVMNPQSYEYQRLLHYANGVCEKIELDHHNFVLEQTYCTKERNGCFFESHEQYIDVQFIAEGEEIMEVIDTQKLHVNLPYDETKDLITYDDTPLATSHLLCKGDVAIFFPGDAHMPCIQNDYMTRVIKTVVKVRV